MRNNPMDSTVPICQTGDVPTLATLEASMTAIFANPATVDHEPHRALCSSCDLLGNGRLEWWVRGDIYGEGMKVTLCPGCHNHASRAGVKFSDETGFERH